VIIGGGLVGVEAGLHLRNTGKNVTVLEMQDEYAPESKMVYKFGLMRKVNELDLTIITGAMCTDVLDRGVKYVKDGKNILPAATPYYMRPA
jgi:pyruvate/2-oxoglutarate dehydrogenase complex dihydrolipoamide dehydrogenase (E3) component